MAVAMRFHPGRCFKRTLGGQTGDTLGAAIERPGELIFLLASYYEPPIITGRDILCRHFG